MSLVQGETALKWPWPLAFICDAVQFISISKRTKATEKWFFQLFPFKYLMNKNWPCHKIGQGQHRVIFCINFVELQSLLLHTNFQDICSSGYEGADFFKGFEHSSHLGHVTMTSCISLLFSSHIGFIRNVLSLRLVVFYGENTVKKFNSSDLGKGQ